MKRYSLDGNEMKWRGTVLELSKWLISVVVVAVVGGLIIMYPEILLAVALLVMFVFLVAVVKWIIFNIWTI